MRRPIWKELQREARHWGVPAAGGVEGACLREGPGCQSMCMYKCVDTHVYVDIHARYMCICSACADVEVDVDVYRYTCIHVCISTYMATHKYMWMYTDVYAHGYVLMQVHYRLCEVCT